MIRIATLGTALLLAFTLITPADVLAQTKDDTLVYACRATSRPGIPPTPSSARASSSATTSSTTSPRAT